MDRAATIAGFSVRLPFADSSDALIDNLRHGKSVPKTLWFASGEAAKQCGLQANRYTARLEHDRSRVFETVCQLIDDALAQAQLDRACLAADNVRLYLTGLGPRVDVDDYMAFYDHNDIEDVTLTKSVQRLHVSNMSQDKLASALAATYRLSYLPPNLHCTSNSSLSALHLGIQAIEQGGVELVLVVNCSQITTQDLFFLESQSMLDSDVVQPFGEGSKSVLFAEGFGAMVLESSQHRAARQMAPGVRLRSNYLQISAGRSNDAAQLSANLLKVMNKALEQSLLGHDALAAIIPHANGSEVSDKAEAQAIASLLGDAAVPVLAYKGQIGYTATGSGLIDLIIGHHALQHGELLSPTATLPIRENVARVVMQNQGVVRHDKQHLLKVGLGVDGSIIGVIMTADSPPVN